MICLWCAFNVAWTYLTQKKNCIHFIILLKTSKVRGIYDSYARCLVAIFGLVLARFVWEKLFINFTHACWFLCSSLALLRMSQIHRRVQIPGLICIWYFLTSRSCVWNIFKWIIAYYSQDSNVSNEVKNSHISLWWVHNSLVLASWWCSMVHCHQMVFILASCFTAISNRSTILGFTTGNTT